jgi:hypothetical protein
MTKVKRTYVTQDFLVNALKGNLPQAIVLTPFPDDLEIVEIRRTLDNRFELFVRSESFTDVEAGYPIPKFGIVLKEIRCSCKNVN